MFCFVRVEEPAASEPRPLFQVIQSLINKLPNGQQVMEEVKLIMSVFITIDLKEKKNIINYM